MWLHMGLDVSKLRYDTMQNVNKKDMDAQAGLHFCCSQTAKTGFSRV